MVFTKKEIRRARLSNLLLDVSQLICQSVFHEKLGFPSDPNSLYQRLKTPNIYEKIKKLRNHSKGIMTRERLKLLYPSNRETDSSKFDIQLWNILFKNICELEAPATGWESRPDAGNTSLAARVIRLKLWRNDLIFNVSTKSLSKAEFEKHWTEAEDILAALGTSKSELGRRKNSILDRTLMQRYLKLKPDKVEYEALLTDEEIRKIKLSHLIFDVAPFACQTVFHEKLKIAFPRKPKDLYKALSEKAIKKSLLKLFKGRVITDKHWTQLYPDTHETSSDTFDIILWSILFRNICKLTPPKQGWDITPDKDDESLEANLVRLKLWRNNFFYATSTKVISDCEFNKEWETARDILTALGISEITLDKKKTASLDLALATKYIKVKCLTSTIT